MTAIDLNSDLGESYGAWGMGDDAAMLAVVSSANVACGFHAGDPVGILKTVRAAVEKGVSIGAHVSYPDRVGFGRRDMDVTSAELIADVIYQIGALKGVAAAAGVTVGYVKPHGALYNRIAHDPKQGQAVIDGIKAIDPSLVLMGLAGAPILDLAAQVGPEGRRRSLRRPRLHAGRPARLAPRSRRGSARHAADRQAHAATCPRRHARKPSTAPRSRSMPSRSACMATAPVLLPSPRKSAAPSRLTASSSGRFWPADTISREEPDDCHGTSSSRQRRTGPRCPPALSHRQCGADLRRCPRLHPGQHDRSAPRLGLRFPALCAAQSEGLPGA